MSGSIGEVFDSRDLPLPLLTSSLLSSRSNSSQCPSGQIMSVVKRDSGRTGDVQGAVLEEGAAEDDDDVLVVEESDSRCSSSFRF